ncbi:ATP-dependent metallopeptidase FtsH/Yme1/Tma family protein, partial [Eubacteriales bacterium OttesenSCG-928-N14]|nr:ATP-dependent metallopeptidase FtsH/Yme1/Tma family protein [Eubacteriales bacterium OttesenSCG-928-N14]
MKKILRGPSVWILLVLFVVLASTLLGNPSVGEKEDVTYDAFLKMLEKNEISTINIVEYDIQALKVGTEIEEDAFPSDYDYSTRVISIAGFYDDLKAIYGVDDLANIPISIKSTAKPEPSWLLSSLPYIILTLAMVG